MDREYSPRLLRDPQIVDVWEPYASNLHLMELSLSASAAFLQGLIDYAGLFPPESRDMAAAIGGFEEARALRPQMVNRFIVPDGRLEELAELLQDVTEPWPLAVTITAPEGDWSRGLADDVVSLRVVRDAMAPVATFDAAEARIPNDVSRDPAAAAILSSAHTSLATLFETVFLEVPITEDWQDLMPQILQAIAEARTAAKIRCGGATSEDFPTPAQIATFIAECQALRVPFKATAGLHHPIRHWDPNPGVMRHGFLNVVGAGILANSGVTEIDLLTEIIAEEDIAAFELAEGRFRWRGYLADPGEVAEARETFMLGYGSCSFTEPVADLIELGII